MATVEARYATATAYVRRAIATVEDRGVGYTVDPVTGIVEWYAGRTKTEQPRYELARIEARWLRAASDAERAVVARDAELLADRVQENLPGAPQDRERTNLYQGETATGTPATSYGDEVRGELGRRWDWVKSKLTDGGSTVGTWLLVGGGVAVAWKALDYLRERERRRALRAADHAEDKLNAELERVAEDEDDDGSDDDGERNAAGRRAHSYSLHLRRGEIEALDFLRGRYGSAEAFVNGLIPLDDDAERALAHEFVRGDGPYRFQIRASDVRKALRATVGDGGDYGSIPNLRSDAVDWVLAEEWRHAP